MFRVLAIDDDPAILRGYKNLYEQNQEGLLDSLLALDDDFEGAFTIKALNPNTLAEYSKINLKTNYVV